MAPKSKLARKGGESSQNSNWDLEEELKFRLYWKDVLLAIYNDELLIKEGWERDGVVTKINAKMLGISEVELIHALFYLENNGLIERRQASPSMELTEKGFDVAVKIDERRETFLYRLSSLLLSGILALTLLTALLHQMNLVDPEWLLIYYVIALGAMMVTFWRTHRRKFRKVRKDMIPRPTG